MYACMRVYGIWFPPGRASFPTPPTPPPPCPIQLTWILGRAPFTSNWSYPEFAGMKDYTSNSMYLLPVYRHQPKMGERFGWQHLLSPGTLPPLAPPPPRLPLSPRKLQLILITVSRATARWRDTESSTITTCWEE